MLTIEKIQEYGISVGPKADMSISEAFIIINGSKTRMEIAGNSYLYGHMRGSMDGKCMVPLLNLKQISDDEWNEMARKQRE